MTNSVEIAYQNDSVHKSAVIGCVDTVRVVSTWGPAVGTDDWFVAYLGRQPFRVSSKEEALSLLPVHWCWSDDEEDVGG